MHSLREAMSRYDKSAPCIVSKKNWNTKEDKDKKMMHAFILMVTLKWNIALAHARQLPVL